jgi:hypothetical protein
MRMYWGSSSDALIKWSTHQTPHSWLFGVGSQSNGLIICQKADETTDFGHSLQTNPTLFIQSADATTVTEWASLAYDGLYLHEISAANTDVAAHGQIWVKDDSPCTLWFTADDGTDTQLGTAASASGISSAANITDHALVRGDGGLRSVQQGAWTLSDAGDLRVGAVADKLELAPDGDEYVYSSADNLVSFGIGGSDRWHMNHNGNLLVATRGYRVDVSGDGGETVYSSADNTLDLVAGGSTQLQVSNSAVTFSQDLVASARGKKVDLSADGAEYLVSSADSELSLFVNSTETVQLGASTATVSGVDLQVKEGSAGSDLYTLTDAATIATDCSKGNVFTVTLAGNRTMGAPTNANAGFTYLWIVKQDGSGSRTLDWSNAVFLWPDGTEPTMSTGANDVDIVSAVYDGTSFYCVFNGDFS